MQKYLKILARKVLKDEIENLETLHAQACAAESKLLAEKQKLEKKVKRYETPDTVLLQYYRIDNIGANGMPPSYLDPDNKAQYTKVISELDMVYRTESFREMMAWALNFHANMPYIGRIKNMFGDEIEVPAEEARGMINGIKAIWDLLVAANKKQRQLKTSQEFDPHDMLDMPDLEEGN